MNHVRRTREAHPTKTLIAGNVVTGEMVEELILSGADIVKVKKLNQLKQDRFEKIYYHFSRIKNVSNIIEIQQLIKVKIHNQAPYCPEFYVIW